MKNYYADPTANLAIAHVDREIRHRQKQEELQEKRWQAEGSTKTVSRTGMINSNHTNPFIMERKEDCCCGDKLFLSIERIGKQAFHHNLI